MNVSVEYRVADAVGAEVVPSAGVVGGGGAPGLELPGWAVALPVVYAEHEKYPGIADAVGDFVYARLQKGEDDIPTAYPPKALGEWAGRLQAWAEGKEPKDLDRIDGKHKLKAAPRDVFAYVIHEGKIRAPAAAVRVAFPHCLGDRGHVWQRRN